MRALNKYPVLTTLLECMQKGKVVNAESSPLGARASENKVYPCLL